ncbi:MAG: glutamyl-tRNA reductase [Chloroflexi bacterium]|nr:glutamyl-tRNA reductase [Chloroflexota bacterium]
MRKGSMSRYYPIFLDIDGRRCVVVGGGRVALRKVRMLLDHGGQVEVISPDLCPGLSRMAEQGQVQARHRNYMEGDLAGAVIAVAATDEGQTNAAVYQEAKARRILINSVDDPKHSDFIVPSYLRRGDVTIAISTEGRSPALARKIRTELERDLANEYAPLARLAGEVRSELKERGVMVSADEWQRALDLDNLTGILRARGAEEAKSALLRELMPGSGKRGEGEPSPLHLCVVGVNHSTMPVEFREKLAASASSGDVPLPVRDHVLQGIVLSTCNRTEVYVVDSHANRAQQAGIDFLKRHTNMPETELLPRLYVYQDTDATRHIFRVASGLDSMIVGEFEILGQVRQALEHAEKGATVGLPLLNLFRQAVQVGRLVREKTDISRNALSVSSVAVEMTRRIVGDLSQCQILVIGAGEAGRLVAKAAKEKGACHIAVTSRSYEKASALALALGGKAVTLANLGEEMKAADIVISCTGAPHIVLDASQVRQAMRARPEKPMVVIDIAVPRDVEAEAGEVENVFLYNIDDLNEVSNSNRRLRERETKRAAAIIEAEVERFASWWQTLGVRDTIGALVSKAESIRQAQLKTTLKKLKGLSSEERDALEAMSKTMMQKLLHEPIERLKKDRRYAGAVSELFNLEPEKLP